MKLFSLQQKVLLACVLCFALLLAQHNVARADDTTGNDPAVTTDQLQSDAPADPAPQSATITIAAYVDGAPATSTSANNSSFSMHAIYTGGEGDYALNPSGFFSSTPYTASTLTTFSVSDSYSTYENIDTTVGSSCATTPFSLVGYTVGDTLSAAAAATPTLTVPNFSSLAGDEYVIVWNKTCPTPQPATVTIAAYLDGALATATSANNTSFSMHAAYTGGEGDYALAPEGFAGSDPYTATTGTFLFTGESYTTSENLNDSVGSSCASTPFSLVGYTSGNTLADAAAATPSLTVPNFSSLTSDEYVIVWNKTCSIPDTTPPTSGGTTSSDDTTSSNTSQTPPDQTPPTPEIPPTQDTVSHGSLVSGGGFPPSHISSVGQVLGAETCGPYLHTYIKDGAKNNTDDVSRLQTFLNTNLGLKLVVDGQYGPATIDAVKKFQNKESNTIIAPWIVAGINKDHTATGYVYKTTQWRINMLQCPSLNLPQPSVSL